MKKTIVLLAVLVLVTTLSLSMRSTKSDNADSFAPRPLPELEAERVSREGIPRGDTGRLTSEALSVERQPVVTRSHMFKMEGATDSSIRLPISGKQARVAVFSAEDGDLDVGLTDPAGRAIRMLPHTRSEEVEAASFSRLVEGRGVDGTLLTTEDQLVDRGVYTLDVRRSRTPVDVIVNDEGGPELALQVIGGGVDNSQIVTLQAELLDEVGNLSGVVVTARVSGVEKPIGLEQARPGVYSAPFGTLGRSGIVSCRVEARGRTRDGLEVLRHGHIEFVTGKSFARLQGVSKVNWTESDLEVTVKVKVSAPGRYFLHANLLGPSGEPVAWAQDARELVKGKHTMTLKFAREATAASGITSGLQLADVELMNTAEMPGVKAPGRIASLPLN